MKHPGGDRLNPRHTGSRVSGERRAQRLKRRLRKFFLHPATELSVGILILVSVTLTLVELSLSEDAAMFAPITSVNHALTLVFTVELTLRFVAESSGDRYVRRYFRRWWIDLLAVVPSLFLIDQYLLLRGLRVFRYFRLLRLVRIFTGAGYLLPHVIRRGAVHIAVLAFALFVTVVVGTALILSFEQTINPEVTSFTEAFWFSLFSLFAGEPIPGPLSTTQGRIVSVAVMFMGVSVFAAFTGTVSAFMIDRMQREGAAVEKSQTMEDHIIVCGLGHVGVRVLEVLIKLGQRVLAIERNEDSEFVDFARSAKVPVIIDDVRKPMVLENAGAARARAVMAVTGDDLTNLEIAIDARQIKPDIRVVLRLFDDRLAMKVHEAFKIQVAFSTSALAAPSFAAAAIDRSVKGSLEIDGRVYIQSEFEVPPEAALAGLRVGDIMREFETHVVLTRNERDGDHWTPPSSHRIEGGSTVVMVGPFEKVEQLKRTSKLTEDLVRAATDD